MKHISGTPESTIAYATAATIKYKTSYEKYLSTGKTETESQDLATTEAQTYANFRAGSAIPEYTVVYETEYEIILYYNKNLIIICLCL